MWSNGDKYEGNFTADLYNGKGKLVRTNGYTYDGDWKDGKKDGDAVST